MPRKNPKIRPIVSGIILIMATFFCQPGAAGGASIVSTEKDIYDLSEMIKVNFSDSPGNEKDWVCIVLVGSPDTDGGDYKYMPKGLSQGVLTFDPPKPGKYEVRAYYNYSRNGYAVSGRYPFSVVSSPEAEAAMAQRMERKIDPINPLEADLPSGQGFVYIFREAFFFSSSFEIQIKANGKPIVLMSDSSYFIFSVPAGDVNFTTGSIRNNSSQPDVESMIECKATIKVRPGHVYYLKLRMLNMPFWALFMDQVPHQEGANMIESYKLTQIKK